MNSAREITLALGGKWHGRYGTACCPTHEDRNPSLSIAGGRDGCLLVKCHAGCDPLDVLAALREKGHSVRQVESTLAREATHREEQSAWRARQQAKAQSEWAKARPIGGTLGEQYLRNRSIRGDLPKTLRFNPNCWHPSATRPPAIVAKVERGNALVGVHRTYLGPDGGKADLSPNKAMLGPVKGGAVQLSDGAGPLIVAEGIETALSVLEMNAAHWPRVWAALSAGGVAGLQLPDTPSDLIVSPDGDKAGREAAEKLAIRAHALGWLVSVLAAPDGKDWNDVAMEAAR